MIAILKAKEVKIVQVDNTYVIQGLVSVGWRNWLRVFGLRFVKPRYDWRTLKMDFEGGSCWTSWSAVGNVYEFASKEAAMEEISKSYAEEAHWKKLAELK